jgi:hypothetical protein
MHKYQPHTTNWTAHSRSDLDSKIGQRQICDYLKSECAMFRNTGAVLILLLLIVYTKYRIANSFSIVLMSLRLQ